MLGLTIDSPHAIVYTMHQHLANSRTYQLLILQLVVGGEAAYIIYYLLHHQLTITIAVAAYDV
jgi:hypothetical protein